MTILMTFVAGVLVHVVASHIGGWFLGDHGELSKTRPEGVPASALMPGD
jgi:hypothetical protein